LGTTRERYDIYNIKIKTMTAPLPFTEATRTSSEEYNRGVGTFSILR